MMRLNSRIGTVLAIAALGLLSCNSSTPGGAILYDRTAEPPVLLDSEIKVETFRRFKGDDKPDVRVLRCTGGVITGSVTSTRHRREGEAPVPFDDYAALWNKDLGSRAFELDTEAMAPKGGMYHRVTVTMGRRRNVFSAQNKTSFLGFSSEGVAERMAIANAIVAVLTEHVATKDMPPEEEDEAPDAKTEKGS